MGVLDKLAAWAGYRKSGKRGTGFAAAELSRLTASLRSETEFINTTLRYQLRTLRARSRQAAQNNPFARRFAQMCVDNIAGPNPFRMEGKNFKKNGKLNKTANEAIECAWEDWGRKGNCELTGRWSLNTVIRLLVRTLAVDGELLLRIHQGPEYGPYGIKLQVIDVDRLWEMNNKALPNGGAINMGVEMTADGTPVAYHLLKRKPAQWQNTGYTYDFEVIPASEIIHVFVPESAEQARGVPWMYAALINLTNLGAFEEAAVIAARVGAANMGFITSPDGGGDMPGDSKDAVTGQPQIDADPGTMQFLPPGYDFASFSPKFPEASVEPFIKAMLRGVAAGIGVAYHNLANDLENVNYSSARIGELDERDSWMVLQNFFIEHVLDPFAREKWMQMAIVSNKLPFDLGKLEFLKSLYWQPRRWAWVDPLKEVKANLEAINGKIASRTRIIAEGGEDIEDVFQELADENEAMDALGLADDPMADTTAASTTAPAEDGTEDDAAENDAAKKPKKGAKAWN